jgi:hypothetical protein
MKDAPAVGGRRLPPPPLLLLLRLTDAPSQRGKLPRARERHRIKAAMLVRFVRRRSPLSIRFNTKRTVTQLI